MYDLVGGISKRMQTTKTSPTKGEAQIRAPQFFLALLDTTTPTTMPTIARMMRMMMKQIQRFLRAALAETTALSVCLRLKHNN